MTDYSEDRVCRNCHESGGDLIAPCGCDGSIKWVHRDCLDKWRAVSQNPESFTTCDICGRKYQFRRQKLGPWPYIRVALLIFLDLVAVFAAIGVIIALCGLVMLGIERGTDFSDSLPGGINWQRRRHYESESSYYDVYSTSSSGPMERYGVAKVVHNAFFLIFVGGVALMFFIIGILFLFYQLCKGCCACITCCCDACCSSDYTATTYDYNTWVPIWWWWYVTSPPAHIDCCCCCECIDCCCDCTDYSCTNCECGCGNLNCGDCDCNCSDCNCSDCNCGDGDCGEAGTIVLIIIVVIIIIIIIIGAIVGIFFIISFIARLISGHIAVLNRQKRAQAYVVVDLSNSQGTNDNLEAGENVILVSPSEQEFPPPPPAGNAGNSDYSSLLE